MPTSAFFAVLRDAAKLAATVADDLASGAGMLVDSADDIASLTGKAAAKTAGVVGDDLAVGAGQLGGVSPSRELPAVWAITKGSVLNKLVLSVVLLTVSVLYPLAITIALGLGAMYLAYEGGEGLLERFHPHALDEDFGSLTEAEKIKGAIRTDLVLSLEILVIALASTGEAPLAHKAMVLLSVSLVMTLAVYGLIALIIRLDDMGFAMARSKRAPSRRLGAIMICAAPVILRGLEPIGMVAMFAVAGGIFAHLAHLEFSNWVAGVLVEVVIGAVSGVVLAGIALLVHHLRKAQ